MINNLLRNFFFCGCFENAKSRLTALSLEIYFSEYTRMALTAAAGFVYWSMADAKTRRHEPGASTMRNPKFKSGDLVTLNTTPLAAVFRVEWIAGDGFVCTIQPCKPDGTFGAGVNSDVSLLFPYVDPNVEPVDASLCHDLGAGHFVELRRNGAARFYKMGPTQLIPDATLLSDIPAQSMQTLREIFKLQGWRA